MSLFFGKLKLLTSGALVGRKKIQSSQIYSVLSRKIYDKFNSRNYSSESDFESDNIVRSSLEDIETPKMPFHEFIFENLSKWEYKTAVEDIITGRKTTYSEIRKASQSVASALQSKFGLVKGDVQAILLPNIPEYTIVFLAGSMTGVVSSTINPSYSSFEISQLVNIVQPKILFTIADLFEKSVEALQILNLQIPIVVIKSDSNSDTPKGAVAFSEVIDSNIPITPVDFDLNDNLAFPFSSGTSGLPKAVQLSHGNIISNIIQLSKSNTLKEKPFADQCSILGILPWFHIYGITVILGDGLREGARLVTLPKFTSEFFEKLLLEEKVEVLYLVPPLILFLANSPIVTSKHFANTQHIVNGAAPIGEAIVSKVLNKNDSIQFCQGYGMTETSPLITISKSRKSGKLLTVGHVGASTLVKVTDLETNQCLPAFKVGEICVKGPQVMKGYLNLPEETQKCFDEDGWFKTGDVGHYDDEMEFFISDRIKELIKVKGFQVAPAELEEFLKFHPKIAESAVIGVDHPKLGQAPKAFVVVKPGETLTEDEVKDFLKGKLSPHKYLEGGVKFVNSIPKSAAGKILRRDLRQMEQETSKTPPPPENQKSDD